LLILAGKIVFADGPPDAVEGLGRLAVGMQGLAATTREAFGAPNALDLLTGRGITLGSISVGSRDDFESMNRAIAMHHLHPVIDRTFPFAEAKEAYRHFEGRSHFGKVVITHG